MILIVIPCYNEAGRLRTEPFCAHLAARSDTHLLFVDDASTDQTAAITAEFVGHYPKRMSLLSLPDNQGKGEAVRCGILHGLQQPFDHVGFFDADLATPLTALDDFLAVFDHLPAIRMVTGARIQRLGATIDRRWYRHYPGRIVATAVSLLLGLPLYDSQCGAKLLDRELAGQLFAEPFSSRWLFDVELFARTIGLVGRQETMRIVYEYPLSTWTDVGQTKITAGYLPKIPLELWRIGRRYRRHLRRP